MKKSITELLWEEVKRMFFELNTEATHDDWCKYQCILMDRIGEEK